MSLFCKFIDSLKVPDTWTVRRTNFIYQPLRCLGESHLPLYSIPCNTPQHNSGPNVVKKSFNFQQRVVASNNLTFCASWTSRLTQSKKLTNAYYIVSNHYTDYPDYLHHVTLGCLLKLEKRFPTCLEYPEFFLSWISNFLVHIMLGAWANTKWYGHERAPLPLTPVLGTTGTFNWSSSVGFSIH